MNARFLRMLRAAAPSGDEPDPKAEKLSLPLVIEPELNRNLIPRIIRGQGTKCVNAL